MLTLPDIDLLIEVRWLLPMSEGHFIDITPDAITADYEAWRQRLASLRAQGES
ncbi:hypothetical protein [Halomonas sp. NCCP-2165]|nr:hypothetical protein [Halomonas sp. NCCP-2165]GKW50122.1 hypothetical protein NCCP2165_23370 [Halomonas sp. NCCP-2165]